MSFTRQPLSNAWTIEKAIFAFVDGEARPHSVTILRSSLQSNSNGKYQVPAGMFVAQYGNSFAFLKRALVTAAFSTGAATGTVNPDLSVVFAPGDVLYVASPSATITFAGTWLANETVTTTIGGFVSTTTAGSTVLADIATKQAADINASPVLSALVTAIASGAVVYLYAKDGRTSYSLTATTNSASGTATRSAATFAVANTAVGTVSSVNTTTGVITLSGNAGVAVPVGASIGVPPNEVLGLCPHSFEFDYRDRYVFPVVTQSRGVYQQSLPYFDEELRTRMQENGRSIKFATRF